MAFPANPELVAVHFIRSLNPGAEVATTIPARSEDFERDGFVQVSTPGGAPDLHTGRRDTLAQVDAYAYREGSRSVPWGKAATLLQRIVEAVVAGPAQRVVSTPSQFLDVRILGAAVNSDPSRVEDDGGMAHFSALLQLWWVPIPEGGA